MPISVHHHSADGRSANRVASPQKTSEFTLSSYIQKSIGRLTEIRESVKVKEVDYFIGNEDVNNAIESPSFNSGVHESFKKANSLCRSRLSAVSDASDAIKAVRAAVDDAIQEISFSLSKAQDEIRVVEEEKRRLVLARGLSSLPEDIQRLIFTEVKDAESYRPWMVPFRLSTVCRRFRTIVTSTPNLWSSVSTGIRRPEAIDIILRRSCSADIDIEIRDGMQDAQYDFYASIKSHCRRWASLDIYYRSEAEIDKIFSSLNPNSLPRLKNVAISSTTNASQLTKFVEYWNILAPNLCALDLHINTPSQYILPASLRRLKLTVFELTDHTVGSTRDLVALLQSAPELEDITLDIRTPEVFSKYHDGDNEVTMPNVAKLSLRMDALYGLKPLLRDVYFPNLRELRFALREKYRDMDRRDRRRRGGYYFDDGHDSDDDGYATGDDVRSGLELMDELLLCGKTYEKLTTLSLKLHFPEETKRHDYGVEYMEDLFVEYAGNCPSLEHLSLETTILIKYLNLPPLRTLTLTRCNIQNTDFLEDCEYDIEDRVEINHCGLIEGDWENLEFDEESKLVLLDPKRGRLPDSRWEFW